MTLEAVAVVAVVVLATYFAAKLEAIRHNTLQTTLLLREFKEWREFVFKKQAADQSKADFDAGLEAIRKEFTEKNGQRTP